MQNLPMESKQDIENILKQRFFVSPTGYPPQNGFLDYGPPLTQIKQQILNEFRRIFVDEHTYEIEPSAILPYDVLKNSGHIDRFSDIVISDGVTVYRADHFIEDSLGELIKIPVNIEKDYSILKQRVEIAKNKLATNKVILGAVNSNTNLENNMARVTLSANTIQFSNEEISTILSGIECQTKPASELTKLEIDFIVYLHNLHSPAGNPFNPAQDHNLMLRINPTQYMRPELAQSQFVNFSRLYDMNCERLPFSSLTIGRSYRNEVSARGGMFRTKEFEQAEIEYFSEDGQHSSFSSVSHLNIPLLSSSSSTPVSLSLSEALDQQIITSTAIAYFIGKAYEFFLRLGFTCSSIRFRQHGPSEMAHYASDCWDAEILTKCGWIECAGIADRGTFDLQCHSESINMAVKRKIKPRMELEIEMNRKELGRRLGRRLQELEKYIKQIHDKEIKEKKKGNTILIEWEGEEYQMQVIEKRIESESFIPRVIEPSFGISRILYALVEQSFQIRDGRNVLSLKPFMAYLHCLIGYLKYLDGFGPFIMKLKEGFKKRGIRFRENNRTCSIGRKYSSADEIGVPYFVIFDFETIGSESVTIRERDSTEQIRVRVDEVPRIIEELVTEKTSWDVCYREYGIKKE